MYGDLANKLILEAKRTQHLNNRNKKCAKLPTYQDDIIKNILKEVNQLKRNAEYLKEQQQLGNIESDAAKCQYFVSLLCMERNKRCLMAYQKLRSDMLDSQVWSSDGTDAITTSGSGSTAGQDITDLSTHEQEYLREYAQLVTEMKSGELTDIDLTGSMVPPSDVFIDVRVLKDAGEIQTEYGVFNLLKDSQFFVRQSDVERLIQQGYLQKI
ncbi:hypothetical protein TBLA_0G02930 [Henningerozyma blattae CBS 6284]|uniref:DNA replication complex GINS protein PSF1 n=1 Tax=Henningerozyma blattae (strain ATCC 34711 / CBS 6284 / DSM 70876 / NBRC 10599 / NRRL Y-10934 / UCD 77-7) TaxID=1071380 RepID=I2H778_HENB6|nr:hypothetical protein TBLA_0G02930 [Tetrapisispora blattae CBS 6284]CCH62230.1 hypothetical protein TBLA_0G02930 [Tetrapisispora blattae CBS 6284]